MLDVGFSELLVFGIIALLVLGPDKLPEAARFAVKLYSKFKRIINNVQTDIDRELHLSELREQINKEMQRIQVFEQNMQLQIQQLQQEKILKMEDSANNTDFKKANPHLHYQYLASPLVLPFHTQYWMMQQTNLMPTTLVSTEAKTLVSPAKGMAL